MSDPIKMGDLVMAVHHHCDKDAYLLGRVYTVATIRLAATIGPCACGETLRNIDAAVFAHMFCGLPLSWLKRIPPLSELEGEDRKEELPA